MSVAIQILVSYITRLEIRFADQLFWCIVDFVLVDEEPFGLIAIDDAKRFAYDTVVVDFLSSPIG